MQAASELGEHAARHQGDGALPRGDADRHGGVFEQRPPESRSCRVVAEKPRVDEGERDSGRGGAQRSPHRVADHDLHSLAGVARHAAFLPTVIEARKQM